MKLSKHAKFWALGALGGVGLFALGVFAQQNGALDIDSTNQDLFSDLKAVFFLDRNGDEIDSIVRLNVSNGTVVSAPTSDLAGGEAKNTLQNNASIIGSTNSVNTSSGAFLIATNSGRVEGESMQSFVWGASNTTLNGYNAIAVATKNTNLQADNTLALAAKDSTVLAKDSVVLGGENITINRAGQASLAVWSQINILGASGALVFNGKTSPLQVDTGSAHTMVVNADNGLIINTNNSNNQKIQLTVSGAIKLWEVNNAPAQASPYISVKTKGSVTCVCGKVNNQNSALSKYTRGNKQIADLCQKVCDDQNITLTAQCGAAATNYPLTQTQWSTDDFCQWGLGHAGAKPTFPALGGQVSWTCESFPSGGPTCTATRKGCWDGIRAAGEQCDLGTNNGKPDSNCSISCENVKAPKCWANAKSYLGSDVAWAQPNGFCADDSVLGETTPAFWNGSTSWQKTWTCKNKNNKNLTCSANRLPPAVAGACGTTLNTCSAGTLSGQTTIPHGDRWSCDGLYGGSNKTCSRCDSGYKYNTTTNICEIDCPNPIYRHTNGVTIKAAACAEAGREYMFEGQKYYVARDKDDIKAKIAANAYPANRIVTTRVTEFNQLFYDNHTFNQDIWNWDTSNVTNMAGMFERAQAFNQPLNNWDTSKVTDMARMFQWTPIFNQLLNSWNTSNVTNMSHMFRWAQAFDLPLNNWNTSKVTNMAGMFYQTQAFNQPLNNWNTSNVTDMSHMFWQTKAFNQPLNNWNTSKVTNMAYMFYQTQAFDQPLNNRRISQIWDENLKDMFGDATAFKTNQPYCTWENWSAKKWNFVNMGLDACINGQCKAYPWNHPSQPATSTVNGCVGGDYQDIADDANSWKWKCNGKNGGISIECSASKQPTCPSGYSLNNGKCVQWKCVEKYWTRTPSKCIGTSTNPKQDCSSLSSTISFFDDGHRCKKQAGCTRVPQSEKTTVAEEAKCFGTWWRIDPSNCSSLPEPSCPASCADPLFKVPLEGATVRGVSRTIRASNCAIWGQLYNFEGRTYYVAKDSQDLKEKIKYEHWIFRQVVTTRVTDMRWLFKDYRSTITGEDLIHWDTSNVTNMSNMFRWARNADPEINYRDIRKVKSMDWMFALAKSFNHSLDNWDISKIQNENLQYMFYSATTFRDKQPYCKWKKWSSKIGNFENMELNACTSKINGQCKTHAWTHASQPATSTANGCLAGDYLDDADTNTYWQWKCKGRDWGSEEICKAPKKIDGKCWSSYMTCQVWTPTNWSEETKGGECYTRTKFRWECWWIGGGRQDSCIEIEEERDRGSWC